MEDGNDGKGSEKWSVEKKPLNTEKEDERKQYRKVKKHRCDKG